ncbi:MAG: EamA family transporter [Vicinamibacterales bacterium]
MASTPTTRLAYVAWVAVCLLWGTTYLAIRIGLETVPPMLLGGIRWTIAGGLILAVLLLRRDRIPGPADWPVLAVLGVLLIGFGNGGVVWAEQTLPSGLTAVLVAVIPFWMIGVERAAGSTERLDARRMAGLVLGFGGIVLLVWPELELGDGPSFLVGVLATQLACLGWAIGSTFSRRRRPSENVLAVAAYQMLFGGLVMFVVGTLAGEWSSLAFNGRTTAAVVYLVVFGSLGGFTAYAYALKHLPLATVSLYAYVNPVIAMVLGTLILAEPMSLRVAVAGAVVLVGMAMVRK